MNGLFVIDKPEGLTSFDVVRRTRGHLARLMKHKNHKKLKVGHTGTLDPFATGVLPLCVGHATRLAQYLLEGEKHYRVVMRLGRQTDTDDREGASLFEADPAGTTEEAVLAALAALVGVHQQVPPRYSAIHVDGQRAYDLARAGVEFELPAREITLHQVTVRRVALPDVEFDVQCSKGTYIRAICRDIGAQLGVYGHCHSLERLESAGFTLEQAMPLADFLEADLAALEAVILPSLALVSSLPSLTLDDAMLQQIRFGQRLVVTHDLPVDAKLALVWEETLKAIATVEPDGRIHAHYVLS